MTKFTYEPFPRRSNSPTCITPKPYGRDEMYMWNLFKRFTKQSYERFKTEIQSRGDKQMNVLRCIISNGRITQAECKYEVFGDATTKIVSSEHCVTEGQKKTSLTQEKLE